MPLPNNDADFYLVIEGFGARGPSFLETDLAQADRDTIVRNFISGQYEDALRVVSFNVAEGWSRDVSEDIAGGIIDPNVDRGRHRCCASNIKSPAGRRR